MQKLFFPLVVFFIFSHAPKALVEAANYNFSLDTLKKFYPGTELSAIQKEFGKGETISSGGAAKSYKFYVAQLRYKFPVFVTVSQNKVVDFFARLPTYFLHDIFHQSLINRYGKQDEYSKVKRNGLYIWNNENGVKLTYLGSCTITCFPQYLHGVQTPLPAGLSGFKTFIQKMRTNKLVL